MASCGDGGHPSPVTTKEVPMIRHVDEAVVEDIRKFLGEDGIKFFRECKEKTGTVMPVITATKEGIVFGKAEGIPHPVHFREGMTIRNRMRKMAQCVDWDASDFDDNWAKAVELAIEEKEGAPTCENMR